MNPNIQAIKLWNALCPKYFPLMILNTFFLNITPYFNLYISAEIINAITERRNINTVYFLVIIVILGNFVLTIVGSILKREFGHQTIILNQKEELIFNTKTLTLDYEDLEKTEIRQLRRKIIESSKINRHGKQSLLDSLQKIISNSINIILSIYLFTEMFIIIISNEFNWMVLFFGGLIIILIVINILQNFSVKKKMATLTKQVSQTMIEKNRIDEVLDCYNMGKDVRLYCQAKLIMKIKNKIYALHKTSFRLLSIEQFKTDIPNAIITYTLQATVYIFVCIYAIKGIFGIGSIIKYIGLFQNLINAIIQIFETISKIENNTTFINDYLAFLNIKPKMNQKAISISKPVINSNTHAFTIEFVMLVLNIHLLIFML